MGKEQEIVLNEGDDSQEPEDGQIQRKDRIREVLDERDFITPLKEGQGEMLDASGKKQPDSDQTAEQEIELSFDEIDALPDNDKDDTSVVAEVEDDGMLIEAEPDDLPNDSPEASEEETHDSADTDTNADGETDVESESEVEDDADIAAAIEQVDSVQAGQKSQTHPEIGSAAKDPDANEKEKTAAAGERLDNEFLALDEDEVEIAPAKTKKNISKSASAKKPAAAGVKKPTSKPDPSEDQPVTINKKKKAAKTSVKAVRPEAVNRPTVINKIVGYALVILVIGGFVFYNNPGLIGLKKASEQTAPQSALPALPAPVQPEHQSVTEQAAEVSPPPSQQDELTARIEQAGDLRDQLLIKREEIDKLDAYYRNGIAELEQTIQNEVGQTGITSFDQALKDKRIELALRTIQRRLAYIKELEKPALWIDRGSEELLYLTRKVQLDLELIDIAGGIDLDKHKRHIRAAVHQYQPTADKLAVNLPEERLIPLETIWKETSNKKKANPAIEKMARNTGDEQVASEICNGNLVRTAELTRISVETAQCLARLNGSELFLNGVPQLLPEAAKELFKWQGKWICLNGVKALSPQVARYLFKWKGSWISLNGLTEFPPELAQDLLKWEGQQLELMGLKYRQTEAEQKTLKYLALWETTGGKLFVPDEIRKEISRIMVSQLR